MRTNSEQAAGGGAWQFWADRGGTFTDIVALDPDGRLVVHKLLSENPRQYEDAVVHGMGMILGKTPLQSILPEHIEKIKLGTTVATNALLERKGARTVLVISKGHKDALQIGYQNRPDIFALKILLPQPLYESVVEADERVTANGDILKMLDQDALRRDLELAYQRGIRSVAICFLHAYKYPAHEQEAAQIAESIGFTHISCSHQVSPLIKFVSRGQTTVADAYLSPVLKRYVDGFLQRINNSPALFMQSNGGLVDAAHFQGKDALLSGPAGGVVGAAKTCALVGLHKIIAFDMGGTSTDVSHFSGQYERELENTVAGIRIRAPMMAVHTVAAGGGSMIGFIDGRLQVGPQSAGASPGPACYRNGGPLTITDCNVLLGRIRPQLFPKVFGRDGDQPIDEEIVREKFSQLTRDINAQAQTGWSAELVAEGFIDIAAEKMANAIKRVSIEKGHDISDYALCSFGGAGGQHACKVAQLLGLRRIVIHPLAGVLSALGIGLADITVLRQQSIERILGQNIWPDIENYFLKLKESALSELAEQGVRQSAVSFQQTMLVRYDGTDFSLPVPFAKADEVDRVFRQAHQERYGFSSPDKPLVLEAISLEGTAPSGAPHTMIAKTESGAAPHSSIAAGGFFTQGHWHDAPVLPRQSLSPDSFLTGPAIIYDDTGTNIIEPGWWARTNELGYLFLERDPSASPTERSASSIPQQQQQQQQQADPIRLELFNNLFISIAEEMGVTLQNTSHSVNIKERLDFSCALFDDRGRLVANAPHIPVHLGSMGQSVQCIMRDRQGAMRPGQAFLLNNPFNGGTHLPDVTVVMPVFGEGVGGTSEPLPDLATAAGADNRPLFYVAARGHHADIGGITPGSMPAVSHDLEEEGVVIDNFEIMRKNVFLEQELHEVLTHAKYPARNPSQNLADVKAQVIACRKGESSLHRLVQRYGLQTVQSYMQFVRENASMAVRDAISKLPDGQFSCTMDDGNQISVAVKQLPGKQGMRLDFSATCEQQKSNLNAPSSICRAAVLYVLRTLVNREMPLNDGCLEPIELIIPPGSLLNPRYPAAVVAGNVETSQAVTDTVYAALGLLAACQGTMNNFTFGNERYQYYETICGGAGAGPDFDGASAVHTHMTNSRLTDPEVLEMRFPVLVERFHIRSDSGGQGKHRGGNGVVRQIKFMEAMTASILSQRRRIAPFGLAGGMAGKVGRNYIIRASQEEIELPGTATFSLSPGDSVVIETPGGGGYGRSDLD